MARSRGPKAPTVRDVADLAGVSPMTVSRVMGGVPTVDPALKGQVMRAVEQLGYEPNRTAAAMRNASSGGIAAGLCVETIENPFSASVAKSLEDALRPHGGLLFTASSEGDPDTERDILLEFYRRRVSGLVVMTVSQNHEFLIPRVHPKIPIVYLDRPALLHGCDQIMTDHVRGAAECTQHLLAQGHRRVGFIGSNITGHPGTERLEGYVGSLAAAGLPADSDLIAALPREGGPAETEQAIERLLHLPDPPTALFVASNSVMVMVARILHRLDVAERIAHITFDDISLDGKSIADIFTPPLSVYAQDPSLLGRLCGETLVRRYQAKEAIDPVNSLVPGRLIPRGSGEILPS